MALTTGQASVFTFEKVAGVLVVKGFDVPLDQREVFAVVLGVAAGALLAGAWGNVVGGVKSLVSRKARRNLSVTVQALQGGLPAEFMAAGTVGRSVQRLVRTR